MSDYEDNQGHEFQEEGLGELPDDLLKERGELEYFKKKAYKDIPPDIKYQGKVKEDTRSGELGSITQGTHVTSTYNSRPINNQEFFVSTNGFVDSCTDEDVVIQYEIPQSRVAVFRSVRWQFLSTDGFTTYVPYFNPLVTKASIRITVNGAPVENVTQNGIDSLQGVGHDWQEIFFVAPAGSLVKVIGIHSFCNGQSWYCHAELRGQLLLSRGLPDNYEIGSLQPEKPRPVVAQPKSPTPAPRRTPTPLPRRRKWLR